MAIWVRAICTKSVSGVSPEDLVRGIAERLPLMAELYGEDGDEETIPRLRAENAAEGGGFGVYLLRYRDNGGSSLRLERWSSAGDVEVEVRELREELEDCEEADVDVVHECLDAAVEAVAIELQMSDTEGMGWPVAIAAASYLASLGEGLIQADGEGWMEPHGLDVEHLIDGD